MAARKQKNNQGDFSDMPEDDLSDEIPRPETTPKEHPSKIRHFVSEAQPFVESELQLRVSAKQIGPAEVADYLLPKIDVSEENGLSLYRFEWTIPPKFYTFEIKVLEKDSRLKWSEAIYFCPQTGLQEIGSKSSMLEIFLRLTKIQSGCLGSVQAIPENLDYAGNSLSLSEFPTDQIMRITGSLSHQITARDGVHYYQVGAPKHFVFNLHSDGFEEDSQLGWYIVGASIKVEMEGFPSQSTSVIEPGLDDFRNTTPIDMTTLHGFQAGVSAQGMTASASMAISYESKRAYSIIEKQARYDPIPSIHDAELRIRIRRCMNNTRMDTKDLSTHFTKIPPKTKRPSLQFLHGFNFPWLVTWKLPRELPSQVTAHLKVTASFKVRFAKLDYARTRWCVLNSVKEVREWNHSFDLRELAAAE